ncbi:MAG: glycerophosphodiester phosphodiesterase family protein [Spirochaetia bacterium]
MEKTPLIFADRGFSKAYPENTLIAFEKAHTEGGCNGFYVNVHITSDREIVVIHDATLERTTNGSGYVKDHSYEEIAQLDAGSKFNPEFSNQKVPLLKEVLDYAKKHQLNVIIEIKNSQIYYDDIERITISIIRAKQMQEQVLLTSFNHLSMEKCKSIGSEIETGLLVDCPLIKSAQYLGQSRSKTFLPNYDVLMYERQLTQDLQDGKFKIYCWGTEKLDDMVKMCELNLDAIITRAPNAITHYMQKVNEEERESLLWS